jgi:hypothetical protein
VAGLGEIPGRGDADDAAAHDDGFHALPLNADPEVFCNARPQACSSSCIRVDTLLYEKEN